MDRDGPPLELRTEEWAVLAEVDGERDVRQLAADLGRSAFDVAKTIYGLVGMGVVETRERQTPIPERQLQQQVESVGEMLVAGRLEDAQKMAAELESSHPDRIEIALLSGRTLLAQRRMRAATEAFARAVGLDGQSAEAHFQLGVAALQTGELDRAVQAWDTYLRLSPNGGSRDAVEQGLAAVRTLSNVLETISKQS